MNLGISDNTSFSKNLPTDFMDILLCWVLIKPVEVISECDTIQICENFFDLTALKPDSTNRFYNLNKQHRPDC